MEKLLRSNADIQRTIQSEARSVKDLISGLPKELGYPWETEDYVQVDDGLDPPFMIPVDMCSAPRVGDPLDEVLDTSLADW